MHPSDASILSPDCTPESSKISLLVADLGLLGPETAFPILPNYYFVLLLKGE